MIKICITFRHAKGSLIGVSGTRYTKDRYGLCKSLSLLILPQQTLWLKAKFSWWHGSVHVCNMVFSKQPIVTKATKVRVRVRVRGV